MILDKFWNEIISEILVPPPPQPDCTQDRDCPSKEGCFDEECKNPCSIIDPCAQNAKCVVHSSLPLRTMSCICLPGFTGKGDVHCDRISKENLNDSLNIIKRVNLV